MLQQVHTHNLHRQAELRGVVGHDYKKTTMTLRENKNIWILSGAREKSNKYATALNAAAIAD